jgi:CSLREA domain-containing protein
MTQIMLVKPFRLLLLVELFAALFLSTAPAHAASFTVNNSLDAPDANPGDGLCRTIFNRCTLRAAIQEANALSGTDTINVPAGTFTLTRAGFDDTALNGDLDINSHLIIMGASQATTIINGNSLDRVFHVTGLFKVSFSNLTIQGGNITQTGMGGAGIANLSGNIQLTRVTLRNNSSIEAGGGLFSGGSATLDQVTLAANHSSTGGGFFNGGKLGMTQSIVDGNSASAGGGGIGNGPGANLTISFTTVSNNSTDGGGGLDNIGGVVNIDSSAILTNTATVDGGGLKNGLNGTLNLVNSTVSGNSAGTSGAGIYVNNGTVTFASVTIANNTSGTAAGVNNGGGLVKLKNTIVGGNLGGSDCAGTLTSFAYNLIENVTCTVVGDTTGNILGLSPLLGPLNFTCDSGDPGPTLGHCAAASPGFERGNPAGCTDFNGVLLWHDQRGPGFFHDRHSGNACDIGSMEMNIDL